MTESSVAQVLCTPELFEAILLEVDAQALLTVAQRVCRHWRKVIQESHQIQVALFFRATAQPHIPDQDPQKNPFIEKLRQGFFHQTWLTEGPTTRRNIVAYHPLRVEVFLRENASW
ncbi:hypothetical protein BJX99DRAFT_62134 [Aspergillus californicus]